MGRQAWDFLTGPACRPFHYFGIAETHVENLKDVQHWREQAKKHHFKLIINRARPTGREQSENTQGKANEGGEWLSCRQHLQMQSLSESDAVLRDLRATGSTALD
eukprot:7312504-Pyramimonas_sp.AAC.1